jgi:hypothetical protein
VTKEVREQDMKIIVEMLQEYNATKENAVIKLQAKFPQNAWKHSAFCDIMHGHLSLVNIFEPIRLFPFLLMGNII